MKEYILKNSGYSIRYHDFDGNGTPVLFIHGLGCAGSSDYPNVVTQAEIKGNRHILVDLLGAGYSDKPIDADYTISGHAKYLSEFVSGLDIERFILFGHSLGGAVALSLADMCRNRLENIILTEPNLDSGGGLTSRAIAAFGPDEFVNEGFAAIIDKGRKSSRTVWAASLSTWLPQAAYTVSRSVIDGLTPSWREILYSLDCPKTFICGERSIPNLDIQGLENNDIHIEIVDNAGHSMALENPKGLAAAISNGIKQGVNIRR
ncbi:MAG: alpha/beta hydrolase [Defluviitaleaceae bacterium]|nr:alpha/beta hydrolase [Defluviitaleaceae bacterium]